jgi:hypothetical protein
MGGQLDSQLVCDSPTLVSDDVLRSTGAGGSLLRSIELRDLCAGAGSSLVFLGVAVQFDPFEKGNFETSFSLHRFQGQALSSYGSTESMRFQALWGSTGFNLYSAPP